MRHDGPEYNFIASLLSGHSQASAGELDWDRIVEVAAREEVLPALHGKIRRPPEVTDFLDAIHELNAVRNRQLLAEVESIALLLNDAGIEPILLKGAAYLTALVYEDPADRLVGDIDLLIPEEKIRLAFDSMVSAGYEPWTMSSMAEAGHHFATLHQAHRLPLELHRGLGIGACDEVLRAAEILEASTPLRLGRAAVRLPSANHLMTHLILHSQLHHGPYYRIWPTLRSMLDLVRLQQRMPPDWTEIRARFAEHRLAPLLNLHLLQVARVLDIAPPFPPGRGGLRWLYRRILWRETRLKYIDPVYLTSRMVGGNRVSLILRLLKHPGGVNYLVKAPFRRSFYRNLVNDFRHG